MNKDIIEDIKNMIKEIRSELKIIGKVYDARTPEYGKMITYKICLHKLEDIVDKYNIKDSEK